VEGNAYDSSICTELALPEPLWDAASACVASVCGATVFGDAFVEHFCATGNGKSGEYPPGT